MQHTKIYLINSRNNWVYLLKYSKEQKDHSSGTIIKVCYLERVGDHKPLKMEYQSLETSFDELTEEEVIAVDKFIAENVIAYKAPLKYSQGLFNWGTSEEAYNPKKPFLTEREQAEIAELKSLRQPLDPEKIDTIVSPHVAESVLKELDPPKRGRPKKIYTQPVNLEVGILIVPNERDNFNHVLLDEDTKRTIKNSTTKLKLKNFLDKEWNLDSVEPLGNRSILNFYGPPGTGKTVSARAVAKILNKNLLQVDYAQVESKWVGETSKNIQKIFNAARQHNAVILFDEADSLVSKRNKGSDEGGQNANYVNQSRNVFMQEMDRFDGVVILTTNLFENYDEALLRRIQQHVSFKLPDKEIRKQLLQNHIPKEVPVDSINFDRLSDLMQGLSGGDIKNVACEAIVSVACEAYEVSEEALKTAKLTEAVLEREILKIKEAKKVHSGAGPTKVIGIQV